MPVLLKEFNHDLGVIVSASHNPSQYNGIKLIDQNGSKLSDSLEIEIEEAMSNIELPKEFTISKESQNGYQTYLEFLNNLINFDLSKFSVLLDAANGSSYKIIEELFNSNKAKYRIISNNPDGENINLNCGATHLDNLEQNSGKNEIGAAFDGDADRLILLDEEGNICNGDVLILLIAKYLESTNQLNNKVVVSTVMANYGFKNSMDKNDCSSI